MYTPTLRPWPALLAATCAALLHTAALAQGSGSAPPDRSFLAVGVAVLPEARAYRDFDNKTVVLPLVLFENRWVRLAGPGLEFKLGQAGPASFGLTLGYARDGYKAGDSPALAGMAERKSGFWLGARFGLLTPVALLSADWSADASGHSKGQKFKLGADHRLSLGDQGATSLTFRVAATWLDSKFVNHYYGVTAAEARTGRPAYRPGATFNTEIGMRVDQRLAPQHSVFGDFGAQALGREIRNSPLVDRSVVPQVRLGYVYRF